MTRYQANMLLLLTASLVGFTFTISSIGMPGLFWLGAAVHVGCGVCALAYGVAKIVRRHGDRLASWMGGV